MAPFVVYLATGLVIGVLLVAAAVTLLSILWWRARRRKRHAQQARHRGRGEMGYILVSTTLRTGFMELLRL